jgi:endoglucanase
MTLSPFALPRRHRHAVAAFVLLFAGASLVSCTAPAGSVGDSKSPAAIRLNTIGFQPDAPKRATIAGNGRAFTLLRESDGAVVFTGRTGAPVTTAKTDTDETVRIADFSAFTTPGRYRLDVPGVGRSAPFAIAEDVWNTPFSVVARAFYLWRCGTAVHATWQGRDYAHEACHLNDGWLDEVGEGHLKKDGIGGWHDAGDYNKYVVNAGVTVGLMLQAWEQFRGPLTSLGWQLPESGNGTPDLLNEIRWELEWLLKMQLPDGRVFHKLSALDFKYWGSPEADPSDRFFSPWSSTATADFTAMLAAAARVYRPYDAAFADRCLAAARRSWRFLAEHPENVEADLHAFHTGGYGAKDETHRLWASAELWETTSETVYRRDFERRAAAAEFRAVGPTWPDVQDLALGTYLQSRHPESRNPVLVARLTENLVATAARIVATADGSANAYARPLGTDRASWSWGANGTVAGQTYLLHLADRLRPDPSYRAAALDALGFLFGRNFNARSYVTGLGANPPEHPHDRRGEPAWPGYLVGGGWPTGRDWVDERANYRVNEIAINWNGALLYALAAFVDVLDVTRAGPPLAPGGADVVAQGGHLVYTVINRGTAPLRLDRIETHAANGCTARLTASVPALLAPGQSIAVAINVKPSGAGPWRVTLRLFYNGDTATPRTWTIARPGP